MSSQQIQSQYLLSLRECNIDTPAEFREILFLHALQQYTFRGLPLLPMKTALSTSTTSTSISSSILPYSYRQKIFFPLLDCIIYKSGKQARIRAINYAKPVYHELRQYITQLENELCMTFAPLPENFPYKNFEYERENGRDYTNFISGAIVPHILFGGHAVKLFESCPRGANSKLFKFIYRVTSSREFDEQFLLFQNVKSNQFKFLSETMNYTDLTELMIRQTLSSEEPMNLIHNFYHFWHLMRMINPTYLIHLPYSDITYGTFERYYQSPSYFDLVTTRYIYSYIYEVYPDYFPEIYSEFYYYMEINGFRESSIANVLHRSPEFIIQPFPINIELEALLKNYKYVRKSLVDAGLKSAFLTHTCAYTH